MEILAGEFAAGTCSRLRQNRLSRAVFTWHERAICETVRDVVPFRGGGYRRGSTRRNPPARVPPAPVLAPLTKSPSTTRAGLNVRLRNGHPSPQPRLHEES